MSELTKKIFLIFFVNFHFPPISISFYSASGCSIVWAHPPQNRCDRERSGGMASLQHHAALVRELSAWRRETKAGACRARCEQLASEAPALRENTNIKNKTRAMIPVQEAALQLAAQAVANSDHEFGLELCKRAGSVIYDPRICSMMGECERPSDRPPCARARTYIRTHACTHAAGALPKRVNALRATPAAADRAHCPAVQATKSRETRSRPSARIAPPSPWIPP